MSQAKAIFAVTIALIVGCLLGTQLHPSSITPTRRTPPDPSVERYRIPVDGAPQKGNPAAKVTIVEFSDFECPFCSRLEPTMHTLEQRYGRDLRIVWKDFPLPQHRTAMPAALAGRAAAARGRFWPMHDAMFTHQRQLDRDTLAKLAHEAGVELGGALDDATLAAAVRRDMDEAQRFAVHATPSLFINGRPVKGSLDADALAPMIEEELANADRALAAGTAARDLYAALTRDARPSAAPPAPAALPPAAAPVQIALGTAPVRGNPRAKVTVVEFSDFQCPACRRAEPVVQTLRAQWGDNVRLVWKHLPLESMHPRARAAAEAALAAGEQGKFWEMHDALFAEQEHLERADFVRRAQALGLDVRKFERALDSGRFRKQVDEDLAQAAALGVNGTPTFFVDGVRVASWPTELGPRAQAALRGERQAAAPAPVAPRPRPGRPDPARTYRANVGDAPVEGGRAPKVTIVEWADLECPFCARMVEPLDALVRAHPDDVRVVFKQLPLPNHPHSHLAAEAALAAQAQGQFWPMLRLLYAHQTALTRADLEGYAKQLGLDVARFGRELDAGTYKAAADAQAAEGARIGVQATPSFFVNGRFHEGAEPLERLEADFAEASKEADALVAKGTPRGKLYDALMKTALVELPKPALLEPEVHAVDPGPKAPSRGAARAPVTIVEWSDFQCPYCKRAADLLATVRGKYGDRVRIVFRNFPLPYHNQAQLAAEAALAAGEQGRFWEMHDQLFAHQGGIDRGVVDGMARTLGLDVARFDAALDGKRFAAAIDADKAAGGTLVDGTPALFVNGHKLSNPGLVAEAVAEELGRKN